MKRNVEKKLLSKSMFKHSWVLFFTLLPANYPQSIIIWSLILWVFLFGILCLLLHFCNNIMKISYLIYYWVTMLYRSPHISSCMTWDIMVSRFKVLKKLSINYWHFEIEWNIKQTNKLYNNNRHRYVPRLLLLFFLFCQCNCALFMPIYPVG